MELKSIEKIAKALSDPFRLKILETIHHEQSWLMCSAIAKLVDVTPSTLSYHLDQLTDAELLVSEKDSAGHRYLINQAVVTAYKRFFNEN